MKNDEKKIIIVAGEESGDMYASKIIDNLSSNNNVKFYGMGSTKMKKTKAKIIVDSSSISVVGFFEILKIYPKLIKSLRHRFDSMNWHLFYGDFSGDDPGFQILNFIFRSFVIDFTFQNQYVFNRL